MLLKMYCIDCIVNFENYIIYDKDRIASVIRVLTKKDVIMVFTILIQNVLFSIERYWWFGEIL